MAPYDPDAEVPETVDWRLAMSGFVTLYRNRLFLDDAVAWLEEHGYQIVTADAEHWTTDADMHRELARLLEFPNYYGDSLDALNDCLGDVACYDYGTTPDVTGLVLVFLRYDAFTARRPQTANAVLDIFADQARLGALIGHRMLCLVQSDDPDIEFEPVGATAVHWNDAEWRESQRHP